MPTHPVTGTIERAVGTPGATETFTFALSKSGPGVITIYGNEASGIRIVTKATPL